MHRLAGVLLSAFLLIPPAHAKPLASGKDVTSDQVVDLTVQTLAASGLVPIPSSELKTISPLIKCMTRNDKDLLGCGKEALYERVLGSKFKDAAPVIECVIGGAPVATCATNAVLSKLPPEVKSALACGNSISNCAKDALLAKLPPEARAVADCAGSGIDPIECAKKNASGDERKAIETLQKAMDPKTGNAIVGIMDSIQKKDWGRLSILVGQQAATVTTCAVMNVVLLPGPHQGPLCETAGNLIAKQAGSAQTFIEQAQAGDIGGMLGTLAIAGLTNRPCALLQTLSSDVEQAVCGVTADIINAGANSPVIAGIVTGILTTNPIAGLALGGLLSIFDNEECVKPGDFYVTHYHACQHWGVFLGIGDAKAQVQLIDQKHRECITKYEDCTSDDNARKICDALTDQFRRDLKVLTGTYNELAAGHAGGFRKDLEADRSRVCGVPDSEAMNSQAGLNYLGSCETMLKKVRPLNNLANNKCSAQPIATPQPMFGTPDSAQKAACERSGKDEFKKMFGEVCAGAGVCFPVEKPPEMKLN